MPSPFGTNLRIASALIGLLGVSLVWCAEPSGNASSRPVNENTASDSTAMVGDASQVSVRMARDRAKLMHHVYLSTLGSMHRHYFQANRSVLPARAMEDVFDEIAQLDRIESHWISVNTPAMSMTHEPRTKFEKDAAAAIAAGKGEFEQIDRGVYRRAGAIPLSDGCVSCHTGFSLNRPTSQRFAGLVISMPVEGK